MLGGIRKAAALPRRPTRADVHGYCSPGKQPAEPYLLPLAAANSTRLLLHPSGLLPQALLQRASDILCHAHCLQQVH